MIRPLFFSLRLLAFCSLLAGSAGLMKAQDSQTAPATPPPAAAPTPTPDSSNVPSTFKSDNTPNAKPSASPGGAPVGSDYKIGPGDVLSIQTWNEAEFTRSVAVGQDGMMKLPLVGDLQVGGKTTAEVEDLLTKALKQFIQRPLVTVVVEAVGSKRYYMDGLVNRPGEYALIVPTTILEAISKAGGLQEFANQKHIYVLRGDQRIYFNYHDVLRGKNMAQNILLKPDDHIVVH